MVRVQEIIGGLLTVLLTCLWVDLRKTHASRIRDRIAVLEKEAEDREERYEREIKLREDMFATFLTKHDHDKLCSNTLLRLEKSILAVKAEILNEIKNSKSVL